MIKIFIAVILVSTINLSYAELYYKLGGHEQCSDTGRALKSKGYQYIRMTDKEFQQNYYQWQGKSTWANGEKIVETYCSAGDKESYMIVSSKEEYQLKKQAERNVFIEEENRKKSEAIAILNKAGL